MESYDLCDQQARLYHAPQKVEQSSRDRRAGCTVLEMAPSIRPQSRAWSASPARQSQSQRTQRRRGIRTVEGINVQPEGDTVRQRQRHQPAVHSRPYGPPLSLAQMLTACSLPDKPSPSVPMSTAISSAMSSEMPDALVTDLLEF